MTSLFALPTIPTLDLKLRPYQESVAARAREYYRKGGRRLLITMPTGAGKGHLFAYIAVNAAQRGPVLILAHRQELLLQTYAKLTNAPNDPEQPGLGIPEALVGLMMGGDRRTRPNAPIQVASVQTLASRIARRRRAVPDAPVTAAAIGMPAAKLVIRDEAHRALAASDMDIAALYPDGAFLGLSVGPDAIVELRGGPFGRGWVGRLDAAFDVAATASRVVDAMGYETVDTLVLGVESRGWTGIGFGWKPVRSMLRHRCDKAVRTLRVNGDDLTLTDDHSVYRVEPSGFRRVNGRGAWRPVARITHRPTREIHTGDVLPADDGREWDALSRGEAAFDTTQTAPPESLVTLDLTSVHRHETGANTKDWYNFRHSGRHGHYLPIETYRRMAKRLPAPTKVYTEGARGCWLSARILLSEWAYVLGFWLGDGWLDGNRIAFAVDAPRVDGFMERLRSLPGVCWKPEARPSGDKCSQVRVSNGPAVAMLRAIFGDANAQTKWIPGEWIMSWPRAARMELIRGLLDSDGHVAKRSRDRSRAVYTTTSLALAQSLLSLLRSVGVRGSMHRRTPSVGGTVGGRAIEGRHVTYRVHWSMHSLAGNNHSRHGARRRFLPDELSFREGIVRSAAAAAPPEWVYDLSMDGHPSFVANGVLVHNTASPYRLDGRGLGEFYDELLVGADVESLIAGGWLVRTRVYSHPVKPNLKGVKVGRGGDYDPEALTDAVDRDVLVGNIVDHWLTHGGLARTFVFAASVPHARHIAERFRARGVPAAFVGGATPDTERKQAIADLRSGRLLVLCSYDVLVEGVDIPEAKCAVFARPTKSEAVYRQAVGRVMRVVPGWPELRTAVVLDHAGCALIYGLPEDAQTFDLRGRERRGGGEVPTKECPGCFRVIPSMLRECPECGWLFGEEKSVSSPKEKDAELVEAVAKEKRKVAELRSSIQAVCQGIDERNGWTPATANKCVYARFGKSRADMTRAELVDVLGWLVSPAFDREFPRDAFGGGR